MTHSALRHYFPIAVGIFFFTCVLAYGMSVPIGPVAVILLVGEILVAFELDHRRLARLSRILLRAVRADHKARLREVH